MITNLLRQNIQTIDAVEDWKEAIALAAKPLLDKQCIEERYIQAMIQNVEDNGPYIVIMPYVAMPHSHSEDGANTTATAILKIRQAVLFPQDKEVYLIIVLAASDSEAHMQLLSDMVDVFMDEEKMESLLKANTKAELEAILQ